MSARTHPPPWRSALLTAAALAIALVALARPDARAARPWPERLDGFNVIAAAGHSFGSTTARQALGNARRLGANAVAIVPFLWQATPASADLVRGKDMGNDELRTAIRDAQSLGLAVVIKPHVWIPRSWAGDVAMNSEADWVAWFANYRAELAQIAHIAEEEKADVLAIGTELKATTQRPEWYEVIAAVRRVYPGRLTYMAHNVEEADAVPFWNGLDAVGVTLYPPLGADVDRSYRRSVMGRSADHLDALAARTGRPVIVGEVGLRSARGAAAKPWESPEEREGIPDPSLQAEVLTDWLTALDRPAVRGVLIWRWLTDPDAGGLTDTDFTVQGKPAERALMCTWTQTCELDRTGVRIR